MSERTVFLNTFKEKIDYRKTAYSKGTMIIDQKSSKNDFIVIEKGLVRVVDVSQSGRDKVLLILKKGEAFPLIWGFDHPDASVFRYEAMKDTVGLCTKISTFKNCLNNDSEFTKVALEMFVQVSWDTLERLKGMTLPFTYEKLLMLLPYLSAKTGRKLDHKRFLIPKEITQQEIADMLGTTRESVSAHYRAAIKEEIIKETDDGRVFDLNKVPEEYIFKMWFRSEEQDMPHV